MSELGPFVKCHCCGQVVPVGWCPTCKSEPLPPPPPPAEGPILLCPECGRSFRADFVSELCPACWPEPLLSDEQFQFELDDASLEHPAWCYGLPPWIGQASPN